MLIPPFLSNMAADKEIVVTKKDVVWNYIAQIVNYGSGLFILPIILNRLSSEEIGMNYLMQSIVFLMALISAEFSRQLGRNITYVLSGAHTIEKKGVSKNVNDTIDYHLLKVVLSTTKAVYKVIAGAVLFFMLSLGSMYMYRATGGFQNIDNSLIIWLLFSFSTFINIYFTYYNSFLSGAAMVMEYNKVLIISRLVYIIITVALLFCGWGLMSIVVGQLISPLLGYYYAHKKFYSEDLKDNLKVHSVSSSEVVETFKTIWYTTRMNVVDCLGLYLATQSGTLVIGGYMTLAEVASYGLMVQLVQILASLSRGVFSSYLPMFFKYRVKNEIDNFVKDLSFSLFVFYITFILGGLVIVYLAPPVLTLIKSNSILPVSIILYVYLMNGILEINHELCANAIVANNEVPFMKASLIGGIGVLVINILTLRFTIWGMLGIVVGQLFVQSVYNHWKWPKYLMDDLGISFGRLLRVGFKETLYRSKQLFV